MPVCEHPTRTVTKTPSEVHLQEDPAAVLERGCNFAPDFVFALPGRRAPASDAGACPQKSEDGGWDSIVVRMERVVNFMQMRHYLTLARKYSEADLIEQITQQNRFYVRPRQFKLYTHPTI